MYKYHSYKKEDSYLREAILIVYRHKCVYCSHKLTLKTMQIDHILAKNALQENDIELKEYLKELRINGFDINKPDYIENYFPCCPSCNVIKGNRNFDVLNFRFFHNLAKWNTEKIVQLIKKLKNNKNVSNLVPEPNNFNEYMESDFKDYILEKFEDYKSQNIAVQTPQLLLMMLEYHFENIISIFNSFKKVGEKLYGSYLIEVFHEINSQYKKEKRLYRENDWYNFLKLVDKATDVLHDQEYKNSITVNILCYTILCYSDGWTVAEIKKRLGDTEFNSLKQCVLENRSRSIPREWLGINSLKSITELPIKMKEDNDFFDIK